MLNILVTGGAGFIGANFILYMMEKYQDEMMIINVDCLTYSADIKNLGKIEKRKNYVFYNADISDRAAVERIFEAHPIHQVVNFAAESHVDRSIDDSEVFLKTNIVGTHTLLDVAKKHWQIGKDEKGYPIYRNSVKFLQVSTDEVYGSLGEEGYFDENSHIDPRSPYAACKASADMMVKAYHYTYHLPINITRCSNNYGPFQFEEKLMPLVIERIIKGEKIPLYGNGLNVRDWLFVEDHCSAIDEVLVKGVSGDIYNIGGNNEIRNIDLVKRMVQIVKAKILKNEIYRENLKIDLSEIDENLIEYVADRLGHDWRYGMDARKIKHDLGWVPKINFEEGLNQTIEWYLDKMIGKGE